MARLGHIAALMGAALALSACARGPNDPVPSNTRAVDLDGRALRCISASDANISTTMVSVPADFQRRLLTPEARAAGIQIKTSSYSVAEYGSVVLYYTNQDASCLLWSEGITLQEYAERLGLSPLGISPFYKPDTAKPATAPVVTPTTPATDTPK